MTGGFRSSPLLLLLFFLLGVTATETVIKKKVSSNISSEHLQEHHLNKRSVVQKNREDGKEKYVVNLGRKKVGLNGGFYTSGGKYRTKRAASGSREDNFNLSDDDVEELLHTPAASKNGRKYQNNGAAKIRNRRKLQNDWAARRRNRRKLQIDRAARRRNRRKLQNDWAARRRNRRKLQNDREARRRNRRKLQNNRAARRRNRRKLQNNRAARRRNRAKLQSNRTKRKRRNRKNPQNNRTAKKRRERKKSQNNWATRRRRNGTKIQSNGATRRTRNRIKPQNNRVGARRMNKNGAAKIRNRRKLQNDWAARRRNRRKLQNDREARRRNRRKLQNDREARRRNRRKLQNDRAARRRNRAKLQNNRTKRKKRNRKNPQNNKTAKKRRKRKKSQNNWATRRRRNGTKTQSNGATRSTRNRIKPQNNRVGARRMNKNGKRKGKGAVRTDINMSPNKVKLERQYDNIGKRRKRKKSQNNWATKRRRNGTKPQGKGATRRTRNRTDLQKIRARARRRNKNGKLRGKGVVRTDVNMSPNKAKLERQNDNTGKVRKRVSGNRRNQEKGENNQEARRNRPLNSKRNTVLRNTANVKRKNAKEGRRSQPVNKNAQTRAESKAEPKRQHVNNNRGREENPEEKSPIVDSNMIEEESMEENEPELIVERNAAARKEQSVSSDEPDNSVTNTGVSVNKKAQTRAQSKANPKRQHVNNNRGRVNPKEKSPIVDNNVVKEQSMKKKESELIVERNAAARKEQSVTSPVPNNSVANTAVTDDTVFIQRGSSSVSPCLSRTESDIVDPKFRWTDGRGGQLEDARFSVLEGGVLSIEDAQPRDSGVYMCTAEGETEKGRAVQKNFNHTLTVFVPPKYEYWISFKYKVDDCDKDLTAFKENKVVQNLCPERPCVFSVRVSCHAVRDKDPMKMGHEIWVKVTQLPEFSFKVPKCSPNCVREKVLQNLNKKYERVEAHASKEKGERQEDFVFQGESLEKRLVTSCPAGYGKQRPDTCVACEPGSYRTRENTTCTPCPRGQYQPDYAMHQCRMCSKGSTTSEGATDERQCLQENGFPLGLQSKKSIADTIVIVVGVIAAVLVMLILCLCVRLSLKKRQKSDKCDINESPDEPLISPEDNLSDLDSPTESPEQREVPVPAPRRMSKASSKQSSPPHSRTCSGKSLITIESMGTGHPSRSGKSLVSGDSAVRSQSSRSSSYRSHTTHSDVSYGKQKRSQSHSLTAGSSGSYSTGTRHQSSEDQSYTSSPRHRRSTSFAGSKVHMAEKSASMSLSDGSIMVQENQSRDQASPYEMKNTDASSPYQSGLCLEKEDQMSSRVRSKHQGSLATQSSRPSRARQPLIIPSSNVQRMISNSKVSQNSLLNRSGNVYNQEATTCTVPQDVSRNASVPLPPKVVSNETRHVMSSPSRIARSAHASRGEAVLSPDNEIPIIRSTHGSRGEAVLSPNNEVPIIRSTHGSRDEAVLSPNNEVPIIRSTHGSRDEAVLSPNNETSIIRSTHGSRGEVVLSPNNETSIIRSTHGSRGEAALSPNNEIPIIRSTHGSRDEAALSPNNEIPIIRSTHGSRGEAVLSPNNEIPIIRSTHGSRGEAVLSPNNETSIIRSTHGSRGEAVLSPNNEIPIIRSTVGSRRDVAPSPQKSGPTLIRTLSQLRQSKKKMSTSRTQWYVPDLLGENLSGASYYNLHFNSQQPQTVESVEEDSSTYDEETTSDGSFSDYEQVDFDLNPEQVPPSPVLPAHGQSRKMSIPETHLLPSDTQQPTDFVGIGQSLMDPTAFQEAFLSRAQNESSFMGNSPLGGYGSYGSSTLGSSILVNMGPPPPPGPAAFNSTFRPLDPAVSGAMAPPPPPPVIAPVAAPLAPPSVPSIAPPGTASSLSHQPSGVSSVPMLGAGRVPPPPPVVPAYSGTTPALPPVMASVAAPPPVLSITQSGTVSSLSHQTSGIQSVPMFGAGPVPPPPPVVPASPGTPPALPSVIASVAAPPAPPPVLGIAQSGTVSSLSHQSSGIPSMQMFGAGPVPPPPPVVPASPGTPSALPPGIASEAAPPAPPVPGIAPPDTASSLSYQSFGVSSVPMFGVGRVPPPLPVLPASSGTPPALPPVMASVAALPSVFGIAQSGTVSSLSHQTSGIRSVPMFGAGPVPPSPPVVPASLGTPPTLPSVIASVAAPPAPSPLLGIAQSGTVSSLSHQSSGIPSVQMFGAGPVPPPPPPVVPVSPGTPPALPPGIPSEAAPPSPPPVLCIAQSGTVSSLSHQPSGIPSVQMFGAGPVPPPPPSVVPASPVSSSAPPQPQSMFPPSPPQPPSIDPSPPGNPPPPPLPPTFVPPPPDAVTGQPEPPGPPPVSAGRPDRQALLANIRALRTFDSADQFL